MVVVEVPDGVEAEGIHRVFLLAIGLLEAQILSAVVVLLHERWNPYDTSAVHDDLVHRRRVPVRLLVALLFAVVLDHHVIGRQYQVVGRLELYRKLGIEAFATDIGEIVAAVLRDCPHLAVRRRIGDGGRPACPQETRRKPWTVAERIVVDVGTGTAGVALRIGTEYRDTKGFTVTHPTV